MQAGEAFVRALNTLERVFPRLGKTRFRNSVEFYSLFMYLWELDRNGAILTVMRRNAKAQDMLVRLSPGVDLLRTRVRQAKGAGPDEQLFADYVLTVQGDTDSLAPRQRRAKLLNGVLGGIFE